MLLGNRRTGSADPIGRPALDRPKLPRYVRQAILAEWLGVSRITIGEAVRDPSAPRKKSTDGEWLYPWPEFNIWYHKYAADRAVAAAAKRRARGEGATEGSELDKIRLRRATLDLEGAELDFAIRRREFMPVEEHLGLLRSTLERVRAGLLAAPGRLAPAVLGIKTVADAQTRLLNGFDDILEALGKSPERSA